MGEAQAEFVWHDPLRRWTGRLKKTLLRLIENDGFGQAKGAAYSLILFFFPFLLFLIALLVVTDALTVLSPPLFRFLSRVLPPGTRTLITNYISAMLASEPTDLLVGTSLIMTWVGSGMMVTFMEGLNRAYHVAKPRSLVRQRLVAIGLVFLVGVPLLMLAGTIIFGSHLEHFQVTVPWFWRLGRWALVLTVATMMIMIIYYVGPHRRQTWRGVLPGAILATALWILATLAFGVYVSRFGRYNVIYGSLGAGIVLLIWMYISSLAVFIGGEFNAVLEEAHEPVKLALGESHQAESLIEQAGSVTDHLPATSETTEEKPATGG
jgi:membrane protein